MRDRKLPPDLEIVGSSERVVEREHRLRRGRLEVRKRQRLNLLFRPTLNIGIRPARGGEWGIVLPSLRGLGLCLRRVRWGGDKQDGGQESQPCCRAKEITLHQIHIIPPMLLCHASSDPR